MHITFLFFPSRDPHRSFIPQYCVHLYCAATELLVHFGHHSFMHARQQHLPERRVHDRFRQADDMRRYPAAQQKLGELVGEVVTVARQDVV